MAVLTVLQDDKTYSLTFTPPLALLTALERYRRAVEVLLDAPYGSVEILRVEELAAVCESIGG